MYIGIDFDGTCTTHDFPKVGKDIGAVPVLKKLVDNGHQLILFTMRSNVINPKVDEKDSFHLKSDVKSGNYLDDAVNWFKDNNIELFGIQTNPSQHTWTSSPKAYAQLYIDDASLGCPLVMNKNLSDRPFVNWNHVEILLTDMGII
jgi:hypothetical protein